MISRFNPRTRVGCDARMELSPCAGSVSIRAPAWGAMATHSKICLFRVPSPPLDQQNRHNLWNQFPLTHLCARPLKEETSRFYVHLRFALELSFGSSHRHLCVAVVKFRSLPPNDLLLGYSVTQPSDSSTLLDNQPPHRTFHLVYQ